MSVQSEVRRRWWRHTKGDVVLPEETNAVTTQRQKEAHAGVRTASRPRSHLRVVQDRSAGENA